MGNSLDPRQQRQPSAIIQCRASRHAGRIMLFELIKRFEEDYGRSPYAVEVAMQYARPQQGQLFYTDQHLIMKALYDMWRDDIILASPTLEQFSYRKHHTGHVKSSQMLTQDRRFQGMRWNESGDTRSFVLDTREAITLKDLRTLLSGRDFEAYQVYKEKILHDDLPRLLDGQDLGHQKVALLGDQGSGTTLLRRYIEQITGIATGSDVTADGSLPLSGMGLIGEHITDERAWITRTTYPIRKAQNNDKFLNFACNKILMIARNPADVIDAKMQQQITGTKSKRAKISNPQFVDQFVLNAIEEANAVYNEAFAQFKSRNVPIHFIRYEELMRRPQETLEAVFKFLLDKKDLEKTVVQKRIQEVIALNKQTREVYPVDESKFLAMDKKGEDDLDKKEKPDGDSYKPTFSGFKENQVNQIYAKLYDAMVFFGYVKGEKLGDSAKFPCNQNYVYFEPSKIIKNIRSKYMAIIQNPVDDKEPLTWCHYQICNQDTLKRNSKYKPEYRAQKQIQIQDQKLYFKRPVFSGKFTIIENKQVEI